ncbi:MAG: hypothetical protein H7X86_14445 [Gorillibacterium sp.]|nr:hypothetical protein [Gorillibacterium sp.]
MKTIQVHQSFTTPPNWAVLQRTLYRLMNEAVDPFLAKYVHSDGTIMWPTTEDHIGIDALDDAYESFHNWPLFYLAGGADKFLDQSEREFDAITRQFTRYDTGHGNPIIVKEYEQGYDWFHQGEGYTFFYYLGLANPNNAINRNRAIKFAGFYLNEDPDAINYDPELNIITSPQPGSMGPGSRNFERHYNPRRYEDWMQGYGLPFHDLEGVHEVEDLKSEGPARILGKAMVERMSKGDVVTNLAVTSLMTHAYLWTGEEKYKQWVKKYVEGWIARRDGNNGIIPDNIGLNGKVGEHTNGKWYGGYYGWTWPHGWLSMGPALVVSAENAALLMQDQSYLDLPRSQIDALSALGRMENDGFKVPFKHGDEGWFEYRHLDAYYMTHIWHMSMKSDDLARLERSRNLETRDWESIIPHRTKDQGGHDHCWAAYLNGEYEQYPEEILAYNIAQVYKRMEFLRKDEQDPRTYTDSYLQSRNPVTMEGLLQLTMGAPLPIYNGGLLTARIRYYDAVERRAGLPEGIAALVVRMTEDRTVIRMVNLNLFETKELIIQAGTYGEHRFRSVQYAEKAQTAVSSFVQGESYTAGERVKESIDNKWVKVVMGPGTEIELTLNMELGVQSPSYELPWNEVE